MKKWIDSVLSSDKVVAMPVMTHPGIEMTGVSVRQAVSDGNLQYQAIKALADCYPSAACTTIMDLTVEAEAFGAQVNFPEDDIPTVVGRLVNDAAEVEALAIPSLRSGRVPQCLLASKLAAANIKDRPVYAGCIGPFSLAGRLYDMSEIMMAIYIEPDTIMTLLDKCTTFLITYCRAMKATGAAGVIMAEPAAGLLSDEDCLVYSTEYVKKIVEAVQDDNFTLVLHNCGNTGHCTPSMIASGARALHFGNRADMVEALSVVPEDILVMGNLDPVSVLQQSSPEEVYQATKDLLEKTAGHRNYVLSTGCDLPPRVPQANLQAFFDALNDFNR